MTARAFFAPFVQSDRCVTGSGLPPRNAPAALRLFGQRAAYPAPTTAQGHPHHAASIFLRKNGRIPNYGAYVRHAAFQQQGAGRSPVTGCLSHGGIAARPRRQCAHERCTAQERRLFCARTAGVQIMEHMSRMLRFSGRAQAEARSRSACRTAALPPARDGIVRMSAARRRKDDFFCARTAGFQIMEHMSRMLRFSGRAQAEARSRAACRTAALPPARDGNVRMSAARRRKDDFFAQERQEFKLWSICPACCVSAAGRRQKPGHGLPVARRHCRPPATALCA